MSQNKSIITSSAKELFEYLKQKNVPVKSYSELNDVTDGEIEINEEFSIQIQIGCASVDKIKDGFLVFGELRGTFEEIYADLKTNGF
jgi:hypothetical protein